jgi:hypothetical protein
MAEANKKIAAALAAVNAYLQEEAVIHRHGMPVSSPQPPPRDFSVWGLSGRQDMMNMRQLIQMKAFSRF